MTVSMENCRYATGSEAHTMCQLELRPSRKRRREDVAQHDPDEQGYPFGVGTVDSDQDLRDREGRLRGQIKSARVRNAGRKRRLRGQHTRFWGTRAKGSEFTNREGGSRCQHRRPPITAGVLQHRVDDNFPSCPNLKKLSVCGPESPQLSHWPPPCSDSLPTARSWSMSCNMRSLARRPKPCRHSACSRTKIHELGRLHQRSSNSSLKSKAQAPRWLRVLSHASRSLPQPGPHTRLFRPSRRVWSAGTSSRIVAFSVAGPMIDTTTIETKMPVARPLFGEIAKELFGIFDLDFGHPLPSRGPRYPPSFLTSAKRVLASLIDTSDTSASKWFGSAFSSSETAISFASSLRHHHHHHVAVVRDGDQVVPPNFCCRARREAAGMPRKTRRCRI